VAVTEDLLLRLTRTRSGRFWKHRGEDGLRRKSSFSSTSYAPRLVARCSMSDAT
jgi:hypothetical protein